MSIGQGRFLEKRIKQKIMQERSESLRNAKSNCRVNLEEELTLENMDEQLRRIEEFEKGLSIQGPLHTLGRPSDAPKGDSLGDTSHRIGRVVKAHCEEDLDDSQFSTQLLGIMDGNDNTGLSQTGTRFAEMKK